MVVEVLGAHILQDYIIDISQSSSDQRILEQMLGHILADHPSMITKCEKGTFLGFIRGLVAFLKCFQSKLVALYMINIALI